MGLFRSIGTTLEMIKWEHSVLTLPFGLTGAVLAARGIPNLHTSIWIVIALVAARSAAMAFNRLADRDIGLEDDCDPQELSESQHRENSPPTVVVGQVNWSLVRSRVLQHHQ